MSEDNTFDLLVIFKDRPKIVIKDVTNYWINENGTCFYFEKGSLKSFISVANVLYFGLSYDVLLFSR